MKKEKLTEEYCKEMDNYAGELLNEKWGKISDYLHEKLSDFDITDMYRETNEKFEERYGIDALIDRVNYHQIVQMRKEEQDILMEQSILMN
jgi:hypothetical protein